MVDPPNARSKTSNLDERTIFPCGLIIYNMKGSSLGKRKSALFFSWSNQQPNNRNFSFSDCSDQNSSSQESRTLQEGLYFLVGNCLRQPAEQQGSLRFLSPVEKSLRWRTSWIGRELEKQWKERATLSSEVYGETMA